MDNKQIIEKLQEIEFVLFSVEANNHLHPEEIPSAHAASQELLKYFSDLSKQEAVYTDGFGDTYTKKDIDKEINSWLGTQTFWNELPYNHLPKLREAIYKHVIAIGTWEHPETILDQIDDDTKEMFLEEIEGGSI